MIGEALKRSAASFNASGTSLDKSIALVTATTEVTQDPASAGTVWKTMSARIRGASTELADLNEEQDEYTKSTSKLRDLVKGLTGFDILKEDGQTFKDIYDIIVGIGDEWKNLTDVQQASLGEALAGKRGANALYAVLNNVDRLKSIYETSMGSEGSAQREEEAYEKSVQYSIDRTKAQMQELSANFLSSDLLKGLIESANTLLGILNDIVEALGGIGTTIAGLPLASIFNGVVLGKKNAFVPSLFKDIASFHVNKENSDALAGLINARNPMIYNQDKIAEKLFDTGSIDEAAAALKKFTNIDADDKAKLIGLAFKDAGDDAAMAAVKFAEASTGFKSLDKIKQTGVAIKNFGAGLLQLAFGTVPGLIGVGVAITGIVLAVKKMREEQEHAKAEELAKEWEKSTTTIDGYAKKIEELRNKLDSGNLSEQEEISIKQELLSIQQQITAEYGNSANGIDLINGKLQEQLGIVKNIQHDQSTLMLESGKNGFKTAFDKMSNVGGNLVIADSYGGNVTDFIKDYIKTVEGLDVVSDKNSLNEILTFSDDLDVNEAISKLEALQLAIRDYQSTTYTDKEDDNFIKDVENVIQGRINNLQETQKKYGNEYQQARDALLKSTTNGAAYDEYKKAGETVRDAVLSGEDDAIDDAVKALGEAEEHFNTSVGEAISSGLGGEINAKSKNFRTLKTDVKNAYQGILDQHYFSEVLKDTNLATDGIEEYVSSYEESLKTLQDLGVNTSQRVWGNIDVSNRQLLGWTKKSVDTWKSELSDWVEDPKKLIGTSSSVLGNIDTFKVGNKEFQIAFSPILQTDDGPVLLSKHEVNDYISGVLEDVGSNATQADIFRADRAHIADLGGVEGSGLIASVGDNAEFVSSILDAQNEVLRVREQIREVMTSKVSDANPYKKNAVEIKKAAESIKASGISIADVRNQFESGISSAAADDLRNLAQLIGVNFVGETHEGQISYSDFLAVLSSSDMIVTGAGDSISKYGSDISYLSEDIKNATEQLSKLMTILNEASSAPGLSKDSIDTLYQMFGKDAQSAIEYTTNGIHLNMEAIAQLQDKYGYTKKSEYLEGLNAELNKLADINEEIRNAEPDDNTSALVSRREEIKKNITELENLIGAYDGANSAYNRWTLAKGVGSEISMYQSMYEGWDEYGKQLSLGRTDNGVREWLELFTGKDMSHASLSELIETFNTLDDTIEGTSYSFKDFYKLNDDKQITQEGFDTFFKAVEEFDSSIAHRGENDKWVIDLSADNVTRLAKAFGTTPELINAIMRGATAFDYMFDQNGSIYASRETAETARVSLKNSETGKYKFSEMDVDTDNSDEIRKDISTISDYLNDSSIDKTDEQINSAIDLMSYLTGHLREIEEANEPEGKAGETSEPEKELTPEEKLNSTIESIGSSVESIASSVSAIAQKLGVDDNDTPTVKEGDVWTGPDKKLTTEDKKKILEGAGTLFANTPLSNPTPEQLSDYHFDKAGKLYTKEFQPPKEPLRDSHFDEAGKLWLKELPEATEEQKQAYQQQKETAEEIMDGARNLFANTTFPYNPNISDQGESIPDSSTQVFKEHRQEPRQDPGLLNEWVELFGAMGDAAGEFANDIKEKIEEKIKYIPDDPDSQSGASAATDTYNSEFNPEYHLPGESEVTPPDNTTLKEDLINAANTAGEFIENKIGKLGEHIKEAIEESDDSNSGTKYTSQESGFYPDGTLANFDEGSGQKVVGIIADAISGATKVFADDNIPKVDGLVESYKEAMNALAAMGRDSSQTVFGNVDLGNRQVLEWNDQNLSRYSSELESWNIEAEELAGTISTVLGMSMSFGENPTEIAFSPLLQTEHGAELLSKDTVSNYINSILENAERDADGNYLIEDIFKRDSVENGGLGLISAVGPEALEVGEYMHFVSQAIEAWKQMGETSDGLTSETEDLGDSASSSEKDINGVAEALDNLSVSAQQTGDIANESQKPVNELGYTYEDYLNATKVQYPDHPKTQQYDMARGNFDQNIEIPVEYRPETEEIDAANETYASTPVEQQVEMVMTTETNTPETPEPMSVDGGTVTTNVELNTDDFNQKIDEVNTALGQLEPKEETVKADVKGKPDVDALNVAIDNVHGKAVSVVAIPNGLDGVQALRREIDQLPPSKTVTITTIHQTINKGTANPSGGGTKKLDGTAHAQGTAHAGGKWGLEQDEDNALINELGEEIIVRGDRWFTVNNGKPAITSLKRDDIVFNHKQSEELLKRGYVSSGHGRMVGRSYANGKNNDLESIGEQIGKGIVRYLGVSDSYHGGGGGKTPAVDNYKNGKKTGDSEKKSSGGGNGGGNGGGGNGNGGGNGGGGNGGGNTDKSKSNADNLVDWIEILLERLAKSLERLKTAADLVDKYTSKIAKYNAAIAQVQTNIRKNEQAEAKYRQKAGSIKIFEKDKDKDAAYKKKIRDGDLSIENISDENVRKKIEEYQKWYDKALECRDTVTDLRLELIELSQTKLDSVVEYFDKFIDRLSTMSDYYEATSDYMEAVRGWGDAGAQRSSRTYMKQQLSQLEKQYAAYLKEYNSQIAKGAKNGGIDRGSTRDIEARKQLADIKTSIVEAKTAIENVDDTIREIGNQRTEAVSNPYNAYGDFLSENASRWQAESDLFEAYNGRQSVNMLRKSALDTNTRAHNLEDLINEYEKTIKANLSEDIWKVGDVEYTNAIAELEKLRAELANTKKEVVDLNKQIIDTNWSNWKKGLEVLNHYQSSINSIVSLLEEFNTFNSKTAKITEYGQSQVNMRMVEMNNAREEVAKYVVALNKLNEEYAKGQRTQFEYEQKYRELYEGELSAAQKVQSARKSILDTVRRGIEAETKAMSDLINKRKEALQRQKEADDYARNMRDRNKEINKIRQQITALSGDTTEETRAKILKLQADLQDKQQELEDTQRDHEYSVITQGLDDELEKFREVQDEKTEALTSSLEYQDQIIKDALSVTTADFKNTVGVIQSLADEYGISIPEALVSGFGGIDFAKLTGLDTLPAKVEKAVDAIEQASQKIHDASQKWGSGEIVRENDTNGHDSGANADRSNTNNDTVEDRPTLVSEMIARLQKEADNAKASVKKTKDAMADYKKKMNEAKAAMEKAEKEYNAIKDDKSVAWSRRNAAKTAFNNARSHYHASMVNYNSSVGAYNQAVSTYNTKKSSLAQYDQTAAEKMANYSTAKKATEPYITLKKTPLRQKADAKGKELLEIPAGKTVQFTGKKQNNYYQVTYGGKTGWVYVGNIEEPPTLEPIVKTPKKTTKLGPSNDPIKKTTNKKTVKLGYAKGTKSSKKGLSLTDEEGVGTEAILTKKGVLRQLDAGTMIFNKAQRENLWEMSKINATSLLRNVSAKTGGFTIQNTYGSLLTVNGNVDKETLPELQTILDLAVDKMRKSLSSTMIKNGFAKR